MSSKKQLLKVALSGCLNAACDRAWLAKAGISTYLQPKLQDNHVLHLHRRYTHAASALNPPTACISQAHEQEGQLEECSSRGHAEYTDNKKAGVSQKHHVADSILQLVASSQAQRASFEEEQQPGATPPDKPSLNVPINAEVLSQEALRERMWELANSTETRSSQPLASNKQHAADIEHGLGAPRQLRLHEGTNSRLNKIAANTKDEQEDQLVPASFEDVGVPQQAVWYELGTGEPLVHPHTKAEIYLLSVSPFHAASSESVRSSMHILRPRVLAVCVPNDLQDTILEAAEARTAVARDADHVKQIADGYHRVCMGVMETSDMNPTESDLKQSYEEGRELAAIHNMPDYETLQNELADDAEALRVLKEDVTDHVLNREAWYAMFMSGMKPLQHFDEPILEASSTGTHVVCVDMAGSQQAFLAEEVSEGADKEREEQRAFLNIMHELGEKHLPVNLPEDLWGIMAPCSLYPDDVKGLYERLGQEAPCTLTMMKYRAAYVARALDTVASDCPMKGSATDPVRIVCIVDRLMDILIRAAWKELLKAPIQSESEQSVVHTLPFSPTPLQKAKRKSRQKNPALPQAKEQGM